MAESAGTTGSSATTRADDAPENRWKSHRILAAAIVGTAFLVPVVAAAAVAHVVGRLLPRPSGFGPSAAWWIVVLASASATVWVVERAARRLLPVAALFRMTLAFPDRAPRRFGVALLRGNSRQLARRVDGGQADGTAADAARGLLDLVARLGRHDPRTRGHSERVRAYSVLIGREMHLSEDDLDKLNWAALVHDVGKLHVAPSLLNKPGKPTDREWQQLRDHPARAEALLAPARPWLGEWLDAATQHHERFDGKGYPGGLAGTDITLAGRIVAVADAYDTMTSARSYKKPLPAAQARYELTRNSGTQFDPEAVRACLQVSIGRRNRLGGVLAWLAQFPTFLRLLAVSPSGAGPTVAAAIGTTAVITASGLVGLGPVATAPALATAAVGTTAAEVPAPPADAPGAVGNGTDPGRGDGSGAPGGGQTAGSAALVPGSDPAAGPTTTVDPVGDGTPTSSVVPGEVGDPTPSPTTTVPAVITVPPNQAPHVVDDARTVALLSTTTIDVLANDSDDLGLVASTLRITSPPLLGTAQVVGGAVRYTALLPGRTTFRYEVCDGSGACGSATVTVTVTLGLP